MSSTEQTQQTDHPPQSSPGTPETPPSASDFQDLPTTSHTIKNAPQHLKPTQPVACMNCPLAVWMLKNEMTLECYCRTLYLVTWETTKKGTITMCDIPAQALEAAQKDETPVQTAQTAQAVQTFLAAETQPAAHLTAFDVESQSFGLLGLGSTSEAE